MSGLAETSSATSALRPPGPGKRPGQRAGRSPGNIACPKQPAAAIRRKRGARSAGHPERIVRKTGPALHRPPEGPHTCAPVRVTRNHPVGQVPARGNHSPIQSSYRECYQCAAKESAPGDRRPRPIRKDEEQPVGVHCPAGPCHSQSRVSWRVNPQPSESMSESFNMARSAGVLNPMESSGATSEIHARRGDNSEKWYRIIHPRHKAHCECSAGTAPSVAWAIISAKTR